MFAYSIGALGNISLMINGKTYSVIKENSLYKDVLELLKVPNPQDNAQKIVELLEVPVQIQQINSPSSVYKNITFDGSSIRFAGVKVENILVDQIVEMAKSGLNVSGWLLFVDKLYSNSSSGVIERLCAFLSHRNMPITTDGCFIAYKAVRSDFYDKYTGKTFVNKVGNVIKEARQLVNDDPDVYCGKGLHAGSLQYAKDYAKNDDIIILVKIDPSNVVTAPKDCNSQKLRCCEYEVIGIFEKPLEQPLVDERGSNVEPMRGDRAMPAEEQDHDWEEIDSELEDEDEDDDSDVWNDDDSWMDEEEWDDEDEEDEDEDFDDEDDED